MQPAIVKEAIQYGPNELGRIFEDHHGVVFRTAYRMTGNAADAEDVMQTVFLRLAGRDPSAGPLAQPESYLRRAAINVSFDLIRQRRRQDGPLVEVTQTGEDRELKDCLRRALARLPARHAEIFVLRHLEGYGNAEIAAITGVNRFLIATTLYRVRRKLQQEVRWYFQPAKEGGPHEQI